MQSKYIFIILILSLLGCKKNGDILISKSFNIESFKYQGRVEKLNDSTLALISTASSISVNFLGNHCEIYLKGEYEPYNYVSYELDGKYLGRFKIQSDSVEPYKIEVLDTSEQHMLKIFKESEAGQGTVLFNGVVVEEVLPADKDSNKYIEFIGNSVTCGAAADSSATPCEIGEYFDHQNAYMSYGPRVARNFDIDFMLSSVSGIGVYRNWNDENIDEPIMPQVYENLYLNIDSTKPFSFSRQPDIVSICLGTNDLSLGDGVKPRIPFDREKYVSNYITFIKTVYKHYPNTQMVLLNSPMIGGETNELLVSCLKEIQSHFETKNKPIKLFEFSKTYNNGCSTHPSVEEHGEIAEELIPFFKDLLNN